MLGLVSSPADLFLPGILVASLVLGVIGTRGVRSVRRRRRLLRRLDQIRLI